MGWKEKPHRKMQKDIKKERRDIKDARIKNL